MVHISYWLSIFITVWSLFCIALSMDVIIRYILFFFTVYILKNVMNVPWNHLHPAWIFSKYISYFSCWKCMKIFWLGWFLKPGETHLVSSCNYWRLLYKNSSPSLIVQSRIGCSIDRIDGEKLVGGKKVGFVILTPRGQTNNQRTLWLIDWIGLGVDFA